MIAAPATAADIVFRARDHTYWLNGSRVPGVTSVLEEARLLDFGLANKTTLEAAREIGSAVHTATELDDRGDLVEESVHRSIRGYLEAWRRFRGETLFEIEEVERLVYCPRYHYAGKLDRIGRFPTRPPSFRALLDIKTGAPQRATGYQTAAYDNALPTERHRERFAVHLNADGSYKIEQYRNPHDLAVFCAALTIYNARHL